MCLHAKQYKLSSKKKKVCKLYIHVLWQNIMLHVGLWSQEQENKSPVIQPTATTPRLVDFFGICLLSPRLTSTPPFTLLYLDAKYPLSAVLEAVPDPLIVRVCLRQGRASTHPELIWHSVNPSSKWSKCWVSRIAVVPFSHRCEKTGVVLTLVWEVIGYQTVQLLYQKLRALKIIFYS